MKTISIQRARRIAIHSQFPRLSGARQPHQRTLRLLDHLGYVQLDTISVVERAHNHTLWVRQPEYQADTLDRLQRIERSVFEYWAHAASVLPMSDFRYYEPMKQAFRKNPRPWAKRFLEHHGDLVKPLMKRIRDEGALASRDVAQPGDRKRGPWWDWRPAKMILEVLFWQGHLMISERRGFQRVYDLAERVVPEDLDTTPATIEETGRFLVRRALQASGIADQAEIRSHIEAPSLGKNLIPDALDSLQREGEVVELQVRGLPKNRYFSLANELDSLLSLRKKAPQLHILCPFDNLIILRDRIERLFGFEYRLECYVPDKKRKYGYYVMPILFGEKLVGRLDPHVDRKKHCLTIRGLWLEDGYSSGQEFVAKLNEKLGRMAEFNNCLEIKASPRVRGPMRKLLGPSLG